MGNFIMLEYDNIIWKLAVEVLEGSHVTWQEQYFGFFFL